MMIKRMELFTLLYNGRLLCMSESRDDCIRYTVQFESFDAEHIEIMRCTNNLKIEELMCLYGEDLLLEYFRDDIILTRIEIRYYNDIFEEHYLDMKTTMVRLVWGNKFISLNMEEKMNLDKTFNILYNKIYDYESFISSLDRDSIFEHYIENPMIVIEKRKQYEYAIESYKYSIENE